MGLGCEMSLSDECRKVVRFLRRDGIRDQLVRSYMFDGERWVLMYIYPEEWWSTRAGKWES